MKSEAVVKRFTNGRKILDHLGSLKLRQRPYLVYWSKAQAREEGNYKGNIREKLGCIRRTK